MGLVEARKIYGYGGKNGMEGLHLWLTEIRKRWPDAKLITQGEFGLLWRAQFKNNDTLDYRFVYRGCGIRASEADKEIRWFMNKDFRLALLRDWKADTPEKVIDFTRYDLTAQEPADPEPGKQSRNWSLMNSINQKGIRPQDKPIPINQLTPEEQALIKRRYPELIKGEELSHFWDPIPRSPSTTVPKAITDEYWHGQYQRVNQEVISAEQTKLVFFGDSITWHWSEGGAPGREVWTNAYAGYHPVNMGNSGDITPVMLYRVTHGNLDFAKGKEPKVAVLLCGVNNFGVTQSDGGKVHWDLGARCPPEDVANGVRAIAQVFRRRLPRTRVLMMGILPVSPAARWEKCRQVNAVHAARVYNPNEVRYLDLQDSFLLPEGSLNTKLYSDTTHPNAAGYRVWAELLDPVLSELLKAEPLNPAKIMLIGDSVTEGADSSGSYRRYLDGMLRRQGYLFDFVGSRKQHNNNQAEPDSYEYDVDHEGHWGKDSDWFAQNMAGQLTNDVPDIAVIHIGTADIVSHTGDAERTTERIVENIGKVLQSLRSKNAAVKIVLARIIPARGKIEEVSLLNQKLSSYAEKSSTAHSPVVIADQQAGFSVTSDLEEDGVLPNASGAEKMAEVFAKTLLSRFPIFLSGCNGRQMTDKP